MNTPLDIATRNSVLTTMAQMLDQERTALLEANTTDLERYQGNDLAMRDRLKVNTPKVNGMIRSLEQLAAEPDPLGVVRFEATHANGMKISNRTVPFGTILIIYESRPDVTIEAAGIAFKSGNHILLKGGKESLHSNLFLVGLWHKALEVHGCSKDWVNYLNLDRGQTQRFLENPGQKVDLIVPRGGETLIAFVKKHATCPVIVSGRGNNFLFVDTSADARMATDIIINAKTDKISACNALDKVLIATDRPDFVAFTKDLVSQLRARDVLILRDPDMPELPGTTAIDDEEVWYREFLDYTIALRSVTGLSQAIDLINTYGGGHSATIVTADGQQAGKFMDAVDAAAVYHNASTRFTDGMEFGLGGELAISTDKLHQRGPIGLQHLVTNKWYVNGNGQTR